MLQRQFAKARRAEALQSASTQSSAESDKKVEMGREKLGMDSELLMLG